MKKNTGKYLLSFIIIGLTYYFIIHKLIQFHEIKEFKLVLKIYTIRDFFTLLIIFILMGLNWGIEAFKWKNLLYKVKPLSFLKSAKAVIAGISVGILTPNRIGEIGGRILFIDKGKRTAGVLAASIGSFSQFIATIFIGILGLCLFLIFFPNKINIPALFNNVSVVILLFLLSILLWGYFNIHKLKPFLLKVPFIKKRSVQLNYISENNRRFLIWILFLSFLRYLSFMIQFYLLLFLYKLPLYPIEAFTSISLIYLSSTLIPTTILSELGLRGSLSIFFIGIFSENFLSIFFSTMSLWIINLAIPAIIGSIILIRKKL